MIHRTWRTNPWSVPLVLTAILFTLTASAYAVTAVSKLDAGRVGQEAESHPWLIEFLDRHGAALMFAELAVLAAIVAAAIGTDRGRAGRSEPPSDDALEEDKSPQCSDRGERGM